MKLCPYAFECSLYSFNSKLCRVGIDAERVEVCPAYQDFYNQIKDTPYYVPLPPSKKREEPKPVFDSGWCKEEI